MHCLKFVGRPFYMRYLICFLLFLGFAKPAQAQSKPGRYKLTGYVFVRGSAPSTYVAEYTLAANGNIDGYTLTSSSTGVLKAKLIGRLEKNGDFFLKETVSLDEHPLPNTYFCFFSANLKKNTDNGKTVYTGLFDSRQPDGTPCEGGTMVLTDVTPIPPAPRPAVSTPRRQPASRPARTTARQQNSVTRPKPATAPTPPTPPTPPPPPKPKRISPADTFSKEPFFVWQSDSVVLEIWDGFEEDGDIISLHFDGQEILHRYKLLNNGKRRLSFHLPDDAIHHMEIFFWEEGAVSPNTPNIIFTDGSRHFERVLTGSYGQKLDIWFARKME